MNSYELHHDTATNGEIIALCASSMREVLGDPEYSRVVKLSDQAVVKFSAYHMEDEASNQRRAYQLLNPQIVRVPRVNRFFTDGRKGYMVMEYMKGQVLDPLVDSDRIRRVADVVDQFANIKAGIPGSLGGGLVHGLLWPDDEEVSFANVQDLEKFFTRRLLGERKLAVKNFDLVLCHLDIAPRNILWLGDDSICFVDWESAGFFHDCSKSAVSGF